VEAILLALGQPQDLLKQGLGVGGGEARAAQAQWAPSALLALSRVVELEALCIGTEGRLSMWRSLRTLASRMSGSRASTSWALIARAEQQLRTLERLRQQASDEAFSDSEGSVVRLTPSHAGRGTE
jgi:hypothetical protein